MSAQPSKTLVLHKDSIMLPDSNIAKKDTTARIWVYRITKQFAIDSLIIGDDINPNKVFDTLAVSHHNNRTHFKCSKAIGPTVGLKDFIIGSKDTIIIEWSTICKWILVGNSPERNIVDNCVSKAETDEDGDKNSNSRTWAVLVLVFVCCCIAGCFLLWRRRMKLGEKTSQETTQIATGKSVPVTESKNPKRQSIESIKGLSNREFKFNVKKTRSIKLEIDANSLPSSITINAKLYEKEINADYVSVKLKDLGDYSEIIKPPFTLLFNFFDKRKNRIKVEEYRFEQSSNDVELNDEESHLASNDNNQEPEISSNGGEVDNSLQESVNEDRQQNNIALKKVAGWLNLEETTEERVHCEIKNLQERNLYLEEYIKAIVERLGIKSSGNNDLLTMDSRILGGAIEKHKNSDLRKIWNETNGNMGLFLFKIQQLLTASVNKESVVEQTTAVLSFDDIKFLLESKFNGYFKNYIKNYLLQKGLLQNQGFSNRTLDDLVDALIELEKKSQRTRIDKDISGEDEQKVINSFIENLVAQINSKIDSENKKVTVENFVERLTTATNAPSSATEIKKKAEELASEQIERANKAKAEAEGQVKLLNKQLSEAGEKMEAAKIAYNEDIKELDRNHQQALKDQETKFKGEKETLELRINGEKVALEQRLNGEKNALKQELINEKKQHDVDLKLLREYLGEYIKSIRTTFSLINESLSKVNSGKDVMMKKILNDIIENRVYSLDYSDEKLKTVLTNAEQSKETQSVAEVKAALGQVFEDCLKEDDPTWLDVLARLYCYTQVPFIASKLAALGINLSRVTQAFYSTVTLLHQFDIEIDYPQLFHDNFDPEKHIQKQTLNIMSYLPGIETDIKNEVADHMMLIVDLRTVGYLVDGMRKEKPQVAKFY